jgi:hypothetical protein
LDSKLSIKNKEVLLNFTGLSHDGGRTDFSENICASLFNAGLLSELTFCQIYLVGQYSTFKYEPNSLLQHYGSRLRVNSITNGVLVVVITRKKDLWI